MKTNQKNPKEIGIMILHAYLFIFLTNFWVYHFFQILWCFSWFRKLPMDSEWCSFMPWWSRDHPRLILDGFGKSHFFHENFQNFESHEGAYFLKNSYVCPNPGQSESTQTSSDPIRETVLNLIKFYRADRKTKNKIEKGSKSGAEDILKIQHPR